MKVIVEKYVYARRSANTSEAPPYYRSPGDVIDTDHIVAGLEIEGNSLWYHATDDGCYYWSGAISQTDELWANQQLDEKTKEAVYKSAANELAPDYRHIAGYSGVAVGYKESGKVFTTATALIFYVNRKRDPAEVPQVIHYRGVQLNTDVREQPDTELIQAIIADEEMPYLMGGSISEYMEGETLKSHGSRTAILTIGKELYLLTCYHVACNSLFEQGKHSASGGKVIFPSARVSTGVRTVKGEVYRGQFNAAVDYALIKVSDINSLENRIDNHQFVKKYYTGDEINKVTLSKATFRKYGAATEDGATRGFASGTLIAHHVEEKTVSASKKLKMKGLVELTKMSDKGDSGAPVIDENDRLLGYIIADNPDSTFVLPFASLSQIIFFEINP